jgi:hypothetical protein
MGPKQTEDRSRRRRTAAPTEEQSAAGDHRRRILAALGGHLVDDGHCASHEEARAILDALYSHDDDYDDDRDGSLMPLISGEALASYFGWTNVESDEIMQLARAEAYRNDNNCNTDNEEVADSDDERMTSREKTGHDLVEDNEEEEKDDEEECVGPGECALCERYMKLTRHHLIPKVTWKRLDSKSCLTSKNLEQSFAHLTTTTTTTDNGADVAARTNRQTFRKQVVDICRPCHSHIHKTYDNWTLATQFNTLERLLDDPAIARFAKWASQQRVAGLSSSNNNGMVIIRSKRRVKKSN